MDQYAIQLLDDVDTYISEEIAVIGTPTAYIEHQSNLVRAVAIELLRDGYRGTDPLQHVIEIVSDQLQNINSFFFTLRLYS